MPNFARITQNMSLQFLQTSMTRIQKDLLEAQRQVSTQTRISAPSDDPAATAAILRLQSTLSKLGSADSAASFGTSILGAQDGALASAGLILQRAKEIAAQQANSLLNQDQRLAAAEEVTELEKAFISTANVELGGRFLFGGLVLGGNTPFTEPNDLPADPFDPPFDPVNTYTGPTDKFVIQVGPSETITIGDPGGEIFQEGITALDKLRVALEAGQSTSSNLDDLEGSLATVRAARTSVGARITRLSDRQAEISSATDTVSQVISEARDTDLAASISTLVHLEQVLTATLAAGSKLLNLNVLDFVSI